MATQIEVTAYLNNIQTEFVKYGDKLATMHQQGNKPDHSKEVKLNLLSAYYDIVDRYTEDWVVTTVTYDWFLPSRDEMTEVSLIIHNSGIGEFDTTTYYWTSSEVDATTAVAYSIDNYPGEITRLKNTEYRVRPIRTFTDIAGMYTVGDVGPQGGWIFYISGTTYYEVAPVSLEETNTWSNVDDTAVPLGAAEGITKGTGAANTLAILSQTGHLVSAASLTKANKVTTITYTPETTNNFFTATEFEDIMIHINAICNSEHWLSL